MAEEAAASARDVCVAPSPGQTQPRGGLRRARRRLVSSELLSKDLTPTSLPGLPQTGGLSRGRRALGGPLSTEPSWWLRRDACAPLRARLRAPERWAYWSGFSGAAEPAGHTGVRVRGDMLQKSAHALREAEKPHDLPSASWRPGSPVNPKSQGQGTRRSDARGREKLAGPAGEESMNLPSLHLFLSFG